MKNKRLLFFVLFLGAAAALILFRLGPGKGAGRGIAKLRKQAGLDKPNVILVTMDTTRADHLACYGYSRIKTPVLDGLAARGVLFENCATATPLTLPSHSTIMTGMYPTYHGVRVNGNSALGEEQTTLAEVFAGRGYHCGAFIAAFVLDGRWGLKQGFHHYDDRFDLNKYKHIDLGAVQRPGNEVMDAALAWLESEKGSPFFAWVHLYDPHIPYEPPEPFRSEYGADPVSRYDGEIAFMDSQIGRLTQWLAAAGLDSKSIIVLVGDHGESLGDHGEGTHGYFVYDSTIRVPLIVVAPFLDPKRARVSSQVRTADVFPTILELAGADPLNQVQGRSLVSAMIDPRGADLGPAYSESMAPNMQFGWSPLYTLRTADFKFIDAPRPEFYDLNRDPGEKTDVQNLYPDRALAMKKDLDRLMRETGQGAPTPQAANLDKETIERLAALGYIGAPVPVKRAGAKGQAGLPDPKDKLPVFESVTEAGVLIQEERYSIAAELLQRALAGEPHIPQALLLLGTCYQALGKIEEAKAALDLVLKDNPENVQALIVLANILIRAGKTEDAVAVCKQMLAVDDRNNQAYALLGEAYIRAHEEAKAVPYLRKAVEIQPKLTQYRLDLAACLVGLKQYESAEPMFKALIRDAPNFPFVHFNLGILYEGQAKWEEARAAYKEEASAFPKEFKAHFNLGKVLLRMGDRRGYLDQMREVVAVAPDQPEGHLFLARGLLLEGAPVDEVQKMVEKGLSRAESSELKALGWFLMADIFSRKHQTENMREALDKANSFQSTHK
jgi:arylsulfatase A-like enzyme/tetratricopeptide (TPR) repeat protein